MSNRVVRSDKQGLYITHDRRKYRLANSVLAKGDKVSLWGTPQENAIRIVRYGPRYEIDVTSGGRTWKSYKSDIEVDETWVTTETAPQIVERLEKGQANLTVHTQGGKKKVTVIIGSDGFDYRDFRREPKGYYQKNTTGMNILIPGKGLMMNWGEWDALVAAIEDARTNVEIGPAVAALKAEVDAEDMLQEYLREQGLSSPDDNGSSDASVGEVMREVASE